ncbi:MAG: chromate transporter [Bryobacteraceae bacterium]
MRNGRLAQLTAIFLRIGNLTFGGGEPTMAALQRELVTKREWLTPEQYALAYSLARITPGTNILAFCAGAAWAVLGWPGAIAAVIAATVPCAVVVVLLTRVLGAWANDQFAGSILAAVLAAAVGLMLASAWLLARPQLKRTPWWWAALLVMASFLAAWKLAFSPIQILGVAALLGFLWSPPDRSARRTEEKS